eukprot:226153_1
MVSNVKGLNQHIRYDMCLGESLSQCPYLKRLIVIMQKHKYNDSNEMDFDNLDVSNALNDFLHLIQKHSDQIEFIFHQFEPCNIKTCNIFDRNYRNRKKNIVDSHNNIIAYVQIMDKIHCYFMHCFDIGNKLLSKEMSIFDHGNNNITSNSDALINQKPFQVNAILRSKRNSLIKNVTNKLENRFNKRYNQLTLQKCHVKHYSFGYAFHYGYCNETAYDKIYYDSDSHIDVSAKYISFREELLSNNMSTISVSQFNNELTKAAMHFNSAYCKQTYRPFTFILPEIDFGSISTQHLLSCMIYCNYTELQYQFSKTYRENGGRQHEEFYFLGRFLKETVKRFGILADDTFCNIKSFYHGLSEKLVFPKWFRFGGIHVPMSTTSSFQVALNFCNVNQGLVMEFYANTGAKCFSMSWLSDYGNENEYLFVQSYLSQNEFFNIRNVFDCQLEFEYKTVLKALGTLDEIVNDSINPLKLNWMQPVVEHSMDSLLYLIISNQLSFKMPTKYIPFPVLTEYAQNVFDSYFADQRMVCLRLNEIKNLSLNAIFLVDENSRFDIELIVTLFTNLRELTLCDVYLTVDIIDEVQRYLNNKCLKLFFCALQSLECSDISVEDTIDKYAAAFRNDSIFMFQDIKDNRLNISKYSDFDFVLDMIDRKGLSYFKDINGEIRNLMDKLISTRLNNSIESNHDQHPYQHFFNEWCDRYNKFYCDWEDVKLKQDGYLFKLFYHSKYDWINIEVINQLFPNMISVQLTNIKLCKFILNNIVQHLKNTWNKTKLNDLLIQFISSESDLTTDDAISMYGKSLNMIGYEVTKFVDYQDNAYDDQLIIIKQTNCMDDKDKLNFFDKDRFKED